VSNFNIKPFLPPAGQMRGVKFQFQAFFTPGGLAEGCQIFKSSLFYPSSRRKWAAFAVTGKKSARCAATRAAQRALGLQKALAV